MKRFEGKVAAVTGGASGIGLAIVTALVREGARVAILDINAAAVSAQALAVDAQDGHVLGIVNDVASEDSVNAAFASIDQAFGRVDVLVNAAGIITHDRLEELQAITWQRVLNVDLASTYFTTRAALPAMKKAGGGAIVNIASVAAIRGIVDAAYCAAKGGLLALTTQLSGELAKFNIRVNTVSPGFAVTAMNTDSRAQGNDRFWIGRIPLRRYAQPEEIAAACLFLASPDASYITGANLVVDGGLTSTILPDQTPFIVEAGGAA